MSIVNRITFFVFAVGLGIGQGFQPVASFNYGAKKYTRVKKAFFFTLTVGEIILGLFAIIAFFVSGNLVALFRDDAQVISIGTLALRFQLMALFLQPIIICTNMLFQSVGANKLAAFTALLRSGLYFIPTIIILSFSSLSGFEALTSEGVSSGFAFWVIKSFISLAKSINAFGRL